MPPRAKENAQVIEHLQTEARKVLDALIPSNAHIILLDYPHLTKEDLNAVINYAIKQLGSINSCNQKPRASI